MSSEDLSLALPSFVLSHGRPGLYGFLAALGLSSFALGATVGTADGREKLMRGFFAALRNTPGASAIYAREAEKARQLIRGDFYKGMLKGSGDASSTVKGVNIPAPEEIPEHGLSHEALLAACQALVEHERETFESGKISGCIYGGEKPHTELQNKVYGLFSLSNPLHPEVFPSIRKMEAEVVRMTINMLQGDRGCVGNMTSGGTESILMAMKAYRELAFSRGIEKPEIIAPKSAHPAFDKAAAYFGIKLKRTRVDPKTFAADVAAMEAAITPNTIALVGSAPNYPNGVIDDISALSDLALKKGLCLHSDACLGGFYLAWARLFDSNIPAFDFSVPGVTSISCDTHKYGYSVKGTSVVLFRNTDLRNHMYFVETEWPGGIYASPTIAGSRPGGLVAATWASLLATGREGYIAKAKAIHTTVTAMKEGIRSGKAGPHLELQGDSFSSVVAFGSSKFNVFELMDEMKHKHGWHLSPLQFPQGLHLCVTYPIAGKEEEFLANLRECSAFVAEHSKAGTAGSAAIYGMTSTLKDRSAVGDASKIFLDCMLEDTKDQEIGLGQKQ